MAAHQLEMLAALNTEAAKVQARAGDRVRVLRESWRENMVVRKSTRPVPLVSGRKLHGALSKAVGGGTDDTAGWFWQVACSGCVRAREAKLVGFPGGAAEPAPGRCVRGVQISFGWLRSPAHTGKQHCRRVGFHRAGWPQRSGNIAWHAA